MNLDFIAARIDEIDRELEREVMEILANDALDKPQKNQRMKPLVSTRKILNNALDSITMVQRLADEENN